MRTLRKFLIFLALLMLISASASAYVVTPSTSPNFKIGNQQGLYNPATIKAADLYATDDLLVVDDAQVYDNLIVNGTIYTNTLSAGTNISTGHLMEDTTVDAGVDITAASGAEIFNYAASTGAFTTGTGTNTLSGNTVISGSKTFTTGTGQSTFLGNMYLTGTKTFTMGTGAAQFGGAVTAASLVVNTTIVGEDLRSSDDGFIVDDFVVDGAARIDETLTVNAISCNTSVAGADLTASDDAIITDDLVVDGAARIDEASTIASLTVNTTCAVGSADGLTVNSVIVPQEEVITIPLSSVAAERNNSACFIASDAWTITHIEEAHPTAETDAATLTVDVIKMTGTQALTGGVNLTEAAFNLKGTANTVSAGAVSTNSGVATLADGNRIGVIINMTGVSNPAQFVNGGITIHMKRV